MYNQQQKIPKLTKQLAETYIARHIGYAPSQLMFTKLTEVPTYWKHACARTGAVVLTPNSLQYYSTEIVYAFCGSCGRVQYYYEVKEGY